MQKIKSLALSSNELDRGGKFAFPHLSVVDRWPATPMRARTALRRFLVIGR